MLHARRPVDLLKHKRLPATLKVLERNLGIKGLDIRRLVLLAALKHGHSLTSHTEVPRVDGFREHLCVTTF